MAYILQNSTVYGDFHAADRHVPEVSCITWHSHGRSISLNYRTVLPVVNECMCT